MVKMWKGAHENVDTTLFLGDCNWRITVDHFMCVD